MPFHVICVKYYRPPIALGPMCIQLLDFAWTCRTLYTMTRTKKRDTDLRPLHEHGIPQYIASLQRYCQLVSPGQAVDLEAEERLLREWLSCSDDVEEAGEKAEAFLDYTKTVVTDRAKAMETFSARLQPEQLGPLIAGDSGEHQLPVRYALESMFAGPREQQVRRVVLCCVGLGFFLGGGGTRGTVRQGPSLEYAWGVEWREMEYRTELWAHGVGPPLLCCSAISGGNVVCRLEPGITDLVLCCVLCLGGF